MAVDRSPFSDGHSPETQEPDENLRLLAAFIGDQRLAMDAGLILEANQNVPRYFWQNLGTNLLTTVPSPMTVKTQPEPGAEFSNSLRLASPDRIEWHSTRKKADGTLIDEFCGHFDRIKP